MSGPWRLIVEGPLSGVENMSRDRAIQIAVEQGWAPPTVRVYRWERPTVTLGRFQDECGLDADACDRYAVDVVRRFTGGRGVLHDDEVTYAVVAGIADGVPRGVAASYRHLCSALVEAYQALGVDAGLTSRDTGDRSSAACYLQTTRADLSAGAAKLSGSAQVWLGTTVLQHGSFTLSRDLAREAALFRLDEQQSEKLRDHTTTIVDLLGRRIQIREVEDAIESGFATIAESGLVRSALTERETELARELQTEVEVRVRP